MSQCGWHNCPAGVKKQVERLVEGFERGLNDSLLGVYLHGSLAIGCFNPLRSDIDLLVATREKMAAETKLNLARLLLEVSNRRAPVEISFLTVGDLHPWRHPSPYDFHYSEDWREEFELELKSDNWKNLDSEKRFDVDLAGHITVLNHRGLCLYGKPIAEIFPNVPERDFIDSILADVLSVKYGLNGTFENYPAYIVLNACRTLAFLRTKQVLSKDEGGRWALENLPARFHSTINESLDEYRRDQQGNLMKASLFEFAAFMKNEIERALET